MTEKDMWKKLYYVSKGVAHVTRIENSASFGTPDIACTYKGKHSWIETKIQHGNRIIFQPSQLAWILQEVAAGGEVQILVGNESTGRMYLYHASELVKPELIQSHNGKPSIDISIWEPYWYGYLADKTCWLSLIMNI